MTSQLCAVDRQAEPMRLVDGALTRSIGKIIR